MVVNRDIETRSLRDSVNILYGNAKSGLLISSAAATALSFGFTDHPQFTQKLLWYSFFCVVLVFRFADALYWQAFLSKRPFSPQAPLRRFVIGGYLTAILWSLYCALFFEKMDTIELATTFIILSAMAGGASTILAANKLLSMWYAIILLIPTSIMCLTQEQAHHQLLGALGLAFAAIMASSSRAASSFTFESIRIRNQHSDLLKEKDSLMKQMTRKNEEILYSNATLEAKVEERTLEIFKLSNIDPLTKLSNRKAFSKSLHEHVLNAQKSRTSLALLFIDLDGFKSVNDTNGHQIGDQLLTKTADRLLRLITNSQALCRWGGDEFLVILDGANSASAVKFANQIIASLSKPVTVENEQFKIGATIGIAMFPEHSTDESTLIGLADTAMYLQKNIEKSKCCVFSKEMQATLIREQKLKKRLSTAIENGEFTLHYQPIVNAKTNKVLYFEALLRWEIDGEPISPAEFIPIAEQDGQIHAIGDWVISNAFKTAKEIFSPHKIGVSINVSVAQLLRQGLAKRLSTMLSEYHLAPELVYIEITESIFASNRRLLLGQIKELRQLNVNISIDDFGTGFSSLALLQSLSANVVKVDRSFVQSIDLGGRAIIQATQYLAKELGYHVVVEGAETQTQVDLLVQSGITCIQGFYYSPPQPISDVSFEYQSIYPKRALSVVD